MRFTGLIRAGSLAGIIATLAACGGGAAAPSSVSPAASTPASAASSAPASASAAGSAAASASAAPASAAGSASGSAAAPSGSAAGQAAPTTSTKDTLNIVFQAQQSTFDPDFAITEQDMLITRNIYEGLLKYKPNSGELTGDLATSWEVSPDGLTYTFHLRPNVQWQKGFGPFTANDVKATFDRLMDPATKAPFRQVVSMLKSVDVVDPLTVKMTLSYPYAPFLQLMVNYRTGGIININAVKKYGADFNYNPIGTGPYQWDSGTPKQNATIVANPTYWGQQPAIKKIVTQTVPDLNAEIVGLENGTYDMIDGTQGADQTVIKQVQSKGFTFQTYNRLTPEVLLWDVTVKPWDNLQVRQAVAYTVDRQQLIDLAAAGIGTPWYSPVPKGFLYATEDGLPHYDKDLNKAKQLLAQAGYPNGIQNVPFQVYDVQKTASDVLSEQLKQVGITTKEEVLDQPTFIARVIGDKGITMALHCCQRQPDPDLILSDMFSPKFRGAIYISHADLESELAQARSELDTTKRQQDYVNLQKEIMDKALMVPLYMTEATAFTKSNLKGFPTQESIWGYDFTQFTFS